MWFSKLRLLASFRYRRPRLVWAKGCLCRLADGAQTQHLGNYTFEIIRRDVDDIVTATDEELVDCMRFFASRMKLVVEPTGCLGFAAARAMKAELKGKRVGVIISGGNIDIDRFAALLAG